EEAGEETNSSLTRAYSLLHNRGSQKYLKGGAGDGEMGRSAPANAPAIHKVGSKQRPEPHLPNIAHKGFEHSCFTYLLWSSRCPLLRMVDHSHKLTKYSVV